MENCFLVSASFLPQEDVVYESFEKDYKFLHPDVFFYFDVIVSTHIEDETFQRGYYDSMIILRYTTKWA